MKFAVGKECSRRNFHHPIFAWGSKSNIFKTENENDSENCPILTKNQFLMHYIIGKGGFGKVWRVEFKKTKEFYAMKIMSKFKVYQKLLIF